MILCSRVDAQVQVTAGDIAPYTAENLISNILLGDGVEIKSIRHDGDDNTIGYFTNGLSDLGLNRGVVMSTGYAKTAARPNDEVDTGNTTSSGQFTISETDLAGLTTTTLKDITRYVITFVPSADTLRFNYVFASEEYPEYVCSKFNDVFGFFITGPNPAGGEYLAKNIARIPNPNVNGFTNYPVSINSVNNGLPGDGTSGTCSSPSETLSFSQYYNDNSNSNSFTFDGYTEVFTAEAIVVPCQEYTIKLVIADGQDTNYDSAVFLEAKSFSTSSLVADITTISSDGSLAEDCAAGEIVFRIPRSIEEDYTVDFNILTDPSLSNLALEGLDYSNIPDQIIIPAGSNSVSLNINVFEDEIEEPTEFIYIQYRSNNCLVDTIKIPIRDNILRGIVLPQDTTICGGDSLLIEAHLPEDFILPSKPSFKYNAPTQVLGEVVSSGSNPQNQPNYYHDIQVSDVLPEILGPNVIDKVCIDTFVVLARDMTIYDFYLIGPDSQILELMTDVGSGLDDGTIPPVGPDIDTIYNLCFKPIAPININNGNATLGPYFVNNPTYTGDFLAEGVWSDLWRDNDYQSNGTWSLLVTLDENPLPYGINNGVNKLVSWSIHFASSYEYMYTWSDDNGSINCVNCQELNETPVESTHYYLSLQDSYGCVVKDTMFVEVLEQPTDLPQIDCSVLSNSSLSFQWSYTGPGEVELMIGNSNEWLPTFQSSIGFTGLGLDESVRIALRINNDGCIGEVVEAICFTPSCVVPDIIVNNVQPPSCSGLSDGYLQVVAGGTQEPYEYFLDEMNNTTGIFNDLTDGIYAISVVDGLGCSTIANVELPAPPVIFLDAVILQEVSCAGLDDAALTFDITGDLEPYLYQWEGGDTSPILEGVGAGSYPITITDRNNCDYLDTVKVVDPIALSIVSIDITNETCFEAKDGMAIPVLNGGIAPYFYSLDGGANFNELLNITDLAPGSYDIMIRDVNDCEAFGSFTIDGSDTLLIVDIDADDQVCFGDNTGSASLSIMGGVSPYTVRWHDGSEGMDIQSVGAVEATVIDAFGCMVSASTFIEAAPAILFNETISQISCHDAGDGYIELDPQGGQGAITLSYNTETDINIPLSGNSLSNLTSGTYLFTAIDERLCSSELLVEITEPQPIILDALVESTGCIGNNTGEIIPLYSGTQGAVAFNWSGPSIVDPNLEIQTGLGKGTYSLTITDAQSCESSREWSVVEEMLLSYNASITHVACKGDASGSILLNSTSGRSPIVYTLIGPDNYAKIDSVHMGLSAGTYRVIVEDSVSCRLDELLFVSEPVSSLGIDFIDVNKLCYDEVDVGEATAVGIGGTSPYDYLWADGSNSCCNASLSTGHNLVSIKDANGCTAIDSIFIEQQDSLVIYLDITDVQCHDYNNGSTELIGVSQGGVFLDLKDLDIEWSQAVVDTVIINNLSAGSNYSITVTDSYGCTEEQQFEIVNPDPLSGEFLDIVEPSCYASSDGRIKVEGQGGVGPYNYVWDDRTGAQSGAEAIDLASDNYFVTVTDANDCSVTLLAFIDEPSALNHTLSSVDVRCFGGDDGQVNVKAEGATPPYSYLWNTNEVLANIENLQPGTYSVSIMDANDCEVIDSITIYQPSEDISIMVESYNNDCDGGSTGGLRITADGGNGDFVYSIDGVNYIANNEIIALAFGVYDVYVKDSKDCIQVAPDNKVEEPQSIIVNLGEDAFVEYNDAYTLAPEVLNAFGFISYEWIIKGNAKSPCLDCSSLALDSIQSDLIIELYITDENGCNGSDLIILDLIKDAFVDVPTAFTPNGDGENDLLVIFGKNNLIINNFSVYDRWGEEVYTSSELNINDKENGWDGQFKSTAAPVGMYVWRIEVVLEDGSKERFSGATQLIR